MLVVSDTSPLNYLVLIERDGLLPALFAKVAAPSGVLAEMQHQDAPNIVRAWASTPPPWLTVATPTSLLSGLNLGRGETEALSLARELKADALLIDERAGARAAQSLGLSVTGTLGVLLLAHERGLAPLTDSLSRLQATSFRASPGLLQQLLDRAREFPS